MNPRHIGYHPLYDCFNDPPRQHQSEHLRMSSKPSGMKVKVLESDRLILRPPVAEDFESFAAMFADVEVTRHIGGVLERAEVWARFLRDCGHWA